MASYKLLAGLQGIFIILCSISVLDFGLSLTAPLSNGSGLGINRLFFSSTEGLIKGTPLANNQWWNYIDFWAYMMILVGFLQVLKAVTVSKVSK